MRVTTMETDLVRACPDWLALHRVLAWRMNSTGVFYPVKKVFRSFRGLPGASDILGILPQSVRLDDGSAVTFGNLLAVEVKRPGERLRADSKLA